MGSLDISFDGSNDDKLEGLLLGGSLGYIDVKVLITDKGIKMGSSGGKVISTILVM